MIKALIPSTSVSSVVDFWFPSDMEDYRLWAKRQGLDPEEITQRACDIGNMVEYMTFNREGREQDVVNRISTEDLRMAKLISEQWTQFIDKEDLDGCEFDSEQNVKYIKDEVSLFHGRYDFSIDLTKPLGRLGFDMKTWGAWNGKPLEIKDYKLGDKLKKSKFQNYLYEKCTGWEFKTLYMAWDGYRIIKINDKDREVFDEMFDITVNMLERAGKNYFNI